MQSHTRSQYLIVDETFAIPIKSSVVERNYEPMENVDSYKSSMSHSINSGFDFFGKIGGGGGGEFSKEFLDLKSRQYHEGAIIMRQSLGTTCTISNKIQTLALPQLKKIGS